MPAGGRLRDQEYTSGLQETLSGITNEIVEAVGVAYSTVVIIGPTGQSLAAVCGDAAVRIWHVICSKAHSFTLRRQPSEIA